MSKLAEQINTMAQDDFSKLSVVTDENGNARLQNADGSFVEEESNSGNQEETEKANPVEESEEGNSNTETAKADEGNENTSIEANNTEEAEDESEGQPAKELTPEQEAELIKAKEDALAFRDTVTKPLKAAGKDYNITDPNEIRTLIQKGIDYQRKTEQIAPLRKLESTLAAHGLTDPTNLAFALDVLAGKPEALAKLIKDKNIDLYSFDENTADGYAPVAVDHNAYENPTAKLQEYLIDNAEDADLINMFNVAKSSYDESSQQMLIQDPNILGTLAEHKRDGIYDKIMQRIDHERAVNGITKPFLEHYYQVGSAMFGNTGNENNTAQSNTQNKPPVADLSAATSGADKAAKAERRAKAGGQPNAKAKSTGNVTFTPEQIRNMPKEEFAKLTASQLMG